MCTLDSIQDPATATTRRLQAYLQAITPLFTEERLQRIENIASLRTRRLTIALEDIYQPHNAAAMLRSCDCFGVQDVHIIENRNRFRPQRSTVAQGAENWLSIHHWRKRPDPTSACINALKQRGYRVLATTLRPSSIPFTEVPLDRPIAILMGTEETGLSECAHRAADMAIYVPMRGFTQSLNVSVTAAILLQYFNARLQSHPQWALSPDDQLRLRLLWALHSCPGAREALRRLKASLKS